MVYFIESYPKQMMVYKHYEISDYIGIHWNYLIWWLISNNMQIK